MLDVAALVLPLFALVFLGYLAGRLARLPVEGLAWLNFFIVWVALPPLFFNLLAVTPVEEFDNLGFLAGTTVATFATFALCFVAALLLRRGDVRVATVQGLAGAYGNIGYLGPPLAIAAFGPAAGVPVALVFCLDNSMHFILAPLLMALGGKERRGRWALAGGILRRILTHPFILATLAGIAAAFAEFRPAEPVQQVLDALAGAAAPCALFAMGVTAALRPLRRVPVELAWLLPVKLVVHPLIVWALVSPLPGMDPMWLHSAMLLAALPTATNVFVIAQQYGVWEERASSTVVLSTGLSILTVSAFLWLVREGAI